MGWYRRYVRWHGKRHPAEMGTAEVEAFLTHLAVNREVAATTQNQAWNALEFLYREVLKVELEGIEASRADLVPSFLDTAEMAKDRKLVADLLPCFREIAPLCEGLEDTIMLANSDNMVGDLAFYQNVKQAAKRGVTGAGTIYEDLKTRFPGRPKKDTPTTP